MIKIRNVKYHHLPKERGSEEYDACLRQIIKDSDAYSFELHNLDDVFLKESQAFVDILRGFVAKAKMPYPFKILHEEAVEQKTPLFFLERKKSLEEFYFISDYITMEKTVNEALNGEISLDELKKYLENVSYKETNDVQMRDGFMIRESDSVEDEIRTMCRPHFDLPEEMIYSVFTGAYHNFEKKAYPIFKKYEDFSFSVLIPEVGSDDQELLYMTIIISEAISDKQDFILTGNYYSNIADWLMKDAGIKLFKNEFNIYFKDTLKQLDEIKGKEVSFEEFDEIMQSADLNKLERINQVLENLVNNWIKTKLHFKKEKN